MQYTVRINFSNILFEYEYDISNEILTYGNILVFLLLLEFNRGSSYQLN